MTFRQFFFELHRQNPFHWQAQLAEKVAQGEWPDALALPTASGKTACVDIAVFAMARQARWSRNQRTAPRRVFFVVDRRVIVDEVYHRMKRIESALRSAKDGVLKEVADELRHLGGNRNAEPILAHQMRGGIYRDQAWIRNPAQPALIASTVDQTGSRLLFQGYGVSASTRPIHAALIANDALIVLDEAHCSVPFGQTLDWIRKYRDMGGVAEELRMPFHVVEMSATPANSEERKIFPLPDADRGEEFLGRRLRASKPAQLIQVRKSGRSALEEDLFQQAVELATKDSRVKNVVVFVNRVASARTVFQKLRESGRDAVLMIGRMRPIDRDELTKQNQNRLKAGAAALGPDTPALFVVATQCLEVGADYDFDALVTECASIDALRQRFGRLNRLGRDGIQAQAVILAPAGKLSGDPVYGDAIHHTWNWLQQVASRNGTSVVDFANEGSGTIGEAIPALGDGVRQLCTPAGDAPILFREYLDIWSQTNPAPDPMPDPGYFLHGKDCESDDVQVVWRADLGGPGDWRDIVSLCPPSSSEAMPVSLRALRKWLTTSKTDEVASDIAQPEPDEKQGDSKPAERRFLIWRGTQKSEVLKTVTKIRPGDTIVVPESYRDLAQLGYIPKAGPEERIDRAEEALLRAKRRVCLRVHPLLTKHWPEVTGAKALMEALASGENDDIRVALRQLRGELSHDQWPAPMIDHLLASRKELDCTEYPIRDGYLLRSKELAKTEEEQERTGAEEDDGDDDLSSSEEQLSLQEHTAHVQQWATHFTQALGLNELTSDFEAAATMHDWGKADERFQAMLLGGERLAAGFSTKLWAKSGQLGMSKAERNRQRELSGIPDHFRHELLSLQMAESRKSSILVHDRDLVLHLIATHHGWARPFAPVVFDQECPAVNLAGAGLSLRWSKEERAGMTAPHLVGSGVPDRFWSLTRKYGWWGLAYLEAIFRLADWSASECGAVRDEIQEIAA